MINDICRIIEQCPDVTKIKMNLTKLLEIFKDKQCYGLIDLITDRALLQSGHYASIFGVNIIADRKLLDDEFQIYLNNIWQLPINYKNIPHINKYLKLKAFI